MTNASFKDRENLNVARGVGAMVEERLPTLTASSPGRLFHYSFSLPVLASFRK